MAKKTPQEVASKWARNLSGATDSIRAGIEAVTESPTAKAARAVDRQVAGVQAAAASGKTQRALMAVTLDEWKNAALNKGLPRIASGATAAEPKMELFMSEFLPFVESQVQTLDSKMPRGDFEQNINRMVAMARALKKFKRQRS